MTCIMHIYFFIGFPGPKGFRKLGEAPFDAFPPILAPLHLHGAELLPKDLQRESFLRSTVRSAANSR